MWGRLSGITFFMHYWQVAPYNYKLLTLQIEKNRIIMEELTPRQNKVSRLIQKDLAEMFQSYARSWFNGSIITVSVVRISPDLSVARCYLSIFPDNRRDEIMASISAHNKEIRYQLGNRIRNQVRIIPELTFFIDDSLDYLENIEKLLKGDQKKQS